MNFGFRFGFGSGYSLPITVLPTAYFNGVFTPAQIAAEGGTYTGGPTVFADNLGVLQTAPSGVPALQGMRFTDGAYYDTALDGAPLLPSVPQPTRTFDAGFTTSVPGPTYKKYTRTNPALDLPGQVNEPARTNYSLNSAVPATHTTGTVPIGTYTLWQEGTGSITATAGSAVGTFGTASNGTPATITITTAGTVVLTASGTNTWVQLESGPFKTSRILTTSAAAVRQGTVLSFPTAGKIPVNNFAIRMTVVPRQPGIGGTYPQLFGMYADGNNAVWLQFTQTSSITATVKKSGVAATVSVSASLVYGVSTDIIFIKSSAGMSVSKRTYSFPSWASWVDSSILTSNTAIDDVVLSAKYQLGALNGATQFAGNISLFDCVPIPSGITDPLAWAKQQWGLPA